MSRSPVARFLRLLFIVVLAGALLWGSRSWWLQQAAEALVYDEPPCRADAGIVMAGDYDGHRLKRMAEVVEQGYVPYALLAGGETYYGRLESDLVMEFARQQGYPDGWFVPLSKITTSTWQEVGELREEVSRRDVHRLLVVTSNYHTARTRRLIQKQMPDFPFCMVAAPDPDFSPSGWWKSREGRKLFVLEWMKTIAEFLGQ